MERFFVAALLVLAAASLPSQVVSASEPITGDPAGSASPSVQEPGSDGENRGVDQPPNSAAERPSRDAAESPRRVIVRKSKTELAESAFPVRFVETDPLTLYAEVRTSAPGWGGVSLVPVEVGEAEVVYEARGYPPKEEVLFGKQVHAVSVTLPRGARTAVLRSEGGEVRVPF